MGMRVMSRSSKLSEITPLEVDVRLWADPDEYFAGKTGPYSTQEWVR